MAYRVVVLGNGVASAERQCFGLLRALWPTAQVVRPDRPCRFELSAEGAPVVEFVRVAWSAASPAAALLRALPAAVHVLAGRWCAGVDFATLAADAASAFARCGALTLLVACGRDTVPAAAAVRAAAPRAVVAVQLLHPRARLSAFDLCVVPAHDAAPGAEWPLAEHVHLTRGALHDLDVAALDAARTHWAPTFASAPQPLVVCLVGGPTRLCAFDGDAVARRLAAVAQATCRAGGTTRCVHVLANACSHHGGGTVDAQLGLRLCRICLSRRTPPCLASALRVATLGVRGCTVVSPCVEAARNPYPGLLAWAHSLVVTADSVSMTSEALSTVRRCTQCCARARAQCVHVFRARASTCLDGSTLAAKWSALSPQLWRAAQLPRCPTL